MMIDMRSFLGIPYIYKLFLSLLRRSDLYPTLIEQYIRPNKGNKILDVGCGTADLLEYLSDVQYTGFDMNPKYINYARRRFSAKGEFYVKRIEDVRNEYTGFDIVFTMGVLHHLDDEKALLLLELARKAIKPNGRLLIIDQCYYAGQSWLARFLLIMDRGRYIRTKEGYLGIVSKKFSNIKVDICNNISRLPYTAIIMECKLQKTL